ncbi:hypothetical protein LIER_08026 [Lithospermum erythrorhizon]|uniref:MADS-box domain-containing protein n=1 Tax=Lithospermum erythrorhizon TaxID=34254 RepID=A0AAV3PEQ5_LITER
MAPTAEIKDGTFSKADKLRFKKRKDCIMKKARELSVLCDIKVCALVIDPDNETIQTWPENRLHVQEILKECAFNNKKVGKFVQKNKQTTSILKMVDEKLEYVNKRIECLKKLNNDQNQSFFVQDFQENPYIQSSQSINCNTGAGGFVQLLQSGFSGELEPMPCSTIQFSQPLQSVEAGILGEFEKNQQLVESIPGNAIIDDGWLGSSKLSDSLTIDTTKEFPYQEFHQMEENWEGQVFQDFATDDEAWEFFQGLDSLLQNMDAAYQ